MLGNNMLVIILEKKNLTSEMNKSVKMKKKPTSYRRKISFNIYIVI